MKTLKAGDKAPDFEAFDQNGKKISLKDFRGKKVVLYFYPKDDTPGCTVEACNLRDNYDDLEIKGYKVIGVSVDNQKSHQKFISKFELPFDLIADTDKKVVDAYGVWGEKKFLGKTHMGTNRTTFLIDGNGIIEKIIDKVDTKNHASQIID